MITSLLLSNAISDDDRGKMSSCNIIEVVAKQKNNWEKTRVKTNEKDNEEKIRTEKREWMLWNWYCFHFSKEIKMCMCISRVDFTCSYRSRTRKEFPGQNKNWKNSVLHRRCTRATVSQIQYTTMFETMDDFITSIIATVLLAIICQCQCNVPLKSKAFNTHTRTFACAFTFLPCSFHRHK